MTADKGQIKSWFIAGRLQGYKRMVVWVDKFSHDNYPSYYGDTGADLLRAVRDATMVENMQAVEEVYDLEGDMDEQLNAYRVYRY